MYVDALSSVVGYEEEKEALVRSIEEDIDIPPDDDEYEPPRPDQVEYDAYCARIMSEYPVNR